jgi:beta-glucosidase
LGKGAVNPSGLDHYERVVDSLLERDIEPMVTLFHWDLPQALEAEGGWYNRDTALWFADYSDIVLARLGDRVPKWLTLNEPWTVVSQGYCRGLHAPGYANYWRAGAAIHHMMLGHGLAVERFRDHAIPGAEVGITHILSIVRAWSHRDADQRAAALLDAERNTVYLDPMFKGTYPAEVRELFPELFHDAVVKAGDLETIAKPVDFLGVNYYLDQFARADSGVPQLGVQVLEPAGPMMTTHTALRPDGLYECIRRISTDYTSVPQYVTELGACLPDYVDPNGEVKDPDRVDYLERAVSGLARAVAEGSDVRGLYIWSLLDNLEWHEGYLPRFGLFHVDFGTQRRTPKLSAQWDRDVILRHAAALQD